ncbi:MAG: tetratricopeptide repeat protein [Casimicrobiaceae bacterium]
MAALCAIPFSLAAQTTEDTKALIDRGEYAAALRVLRELAAQGDAEAQYTIGSMYGTGRGVTKNYAEAVRWIRQAAEKGHAPAQYDLAIMHRDAVGVAKDNAETMRWYRKAADQGFAHAQHNLAIRYERGIGVEQDDAEAARWFGRAAEQGFAISQACLGFMYGNGRAPSPDLVEAYKWLSLSVEGLQGTERAEAVGYRDQLAKRLTRVQIAQAERLVRNWRPKGRWGSPYSLGYPLEGVPAGEASAVAAEQAIDMGSYSLRAPLGEGWRLMSDPIHGIATFMRGPPNGEPGWIVVGPNVLRSEVVTATEHEMATTIQRFEEKSLRERGAMKSYAPGKVKTEVETLGDKTLYVMRYTITDRSRGFPIEVRYAMCVYLPPNVKETRRVYVFTVGKIRRAGLSEDADVLLEAHAVIGSLREK